MSDIIKVLFLAANPVDTGPLRLGEEAREIELQIELGSARHRFEFVQHHALRVSDLQRALLKHKPHIVHFSGHGSTAEEIVLEDHLGKSKQVSRQVIADLFRILKDNIRIVVLNACFSKGQAEALSGTIDYTVGTNKAVGDKAAIAFASAFYLALAFERSVQDAFDLACVEIGLRGLAGADTPEMFIRESVDGQESFLSQKDVIGRGYVDKLKPALEHIVAGTSTEEERRVVKRGIANGSVLLESLEGGAESIADIGEAVDAAGESRSVSVELSPTTYVRIQEELYPPPPGLAPPLPGLSVVGREESLKELKSLVGVGGDARSGHTLTVVRGWPGVGKTTLVGVVGRDSDVKQTFHDGVLWASLEQKPELLSTLAAWGRALGTDDLLKAPTLQEATDRLAALLRHKRMLLIVDDVWDTAHAWPFLQVSSDTNCALLITTRLTSVAEALQAGEDRTYLLPVLTEENALILLHNLAPAIVKEHPDECLELVRDLECLPLALHVAGRLLKAEAKMGFNVIDLINGIRAGAKLLPEPAPIDRAEGATLPTVSALLQRSTDQLDEATRDCFAYLGVFAPKPATFDLEAIQAVWQTNDPKPIVRKLVGHGLLEPVGLGRFQMHALLVQHAGSLLT
ncbi:MAG TPA: NB-ARC domain-containing protein [Pyrinomonadaceae bacterium]|jgi:hypothetical protein|nr:NB-ARC domain-containing protein [Pyrinomonadaceae bacterium]